MNMFARFDENPAMTLRVIKETKRYGRTHGRTDGRTDGQRENSIPPTNKVCGGYNNSNKMDWAYPRIIPVKCQISGIKCPNSTIRIIRAKLAVIPANTFCQNTP